jgi:Fur family peroxide stress response transcriptional regulator
MDTTDELDVLRQSGLRSTPQRVAIVREVFSRSHPTVGEVYESVRCQFPTIGLATVYNPLRTMTERGLVSELSFSSAMRFDANMTPHANLVCHNCGGIGAVEFVPEHLDTMLQHLAQPAGFAPEGQRFDANGLCRSCAAPGISSRGHPHRVRQAGQGAEGARSRQSDAPDQLRPSSPCCRARGR